MQYIRLFVVFFPLANDWASFDRAFPLLVSFDSHQFKLVWVLSFVIGEVLHDIKDLLQTFVVMHGCSGLELLFPQTFHNPNLLLPQNPFLHSYIKNRNLLNWLDKSINLLLYIHFSILDCSGKRPGV